MPFYVICILFFFSSRRRHTRFKCDWSSDVCSSDLLLLLCRDPSLGCIGSCLCLCQELLRLVVVLEGLFILSLNLSQSGREVIVSELQLLSGVFIRALCYKSLYRRLSGSNLLNWLLAAACCKDQHSQSGDHKI